MPAGRPNAKALLQKVNSQLRGERVPLKTKEEDELAVYLQSITQKTQQAKTVGFEDNGDISISSGVQSVTPRGQKITSPAPSSNKFLKKKKPVQDNEYERAKTFQRDSDDEKSDQDKGIYIAGKKKGPPSKRSNERQSTVSALDKANALTRKITSWSSRSRLRHRSQSGDSESDESLRGSETGKRPGSADTSIGRDGNKFLKKKGVPDDSRFGRRSPSPQLHYQKSLSQEKEAPPKSNKTKGEIVRTLGSVYLTSEEESLAEFIHGLSASESLKKPQNLVTKKQQKWRKKSSPSPSGRQSPSIHVSRSPSPFKNRSPSPYGRLSRSQSQDSDLVESMTSEILEIKRQDDSVSSGDRFGVNLMDISSLLPADPSPTPLDQRQKKQKKAKSQVKSKSSSSFSFKSEKKEKNQRDFKNKKKKEMNASSSKDDFFESLGIQMIDDIDVLDANGGDKDDKDNEISVTEESEIRTEKSDDFRRSRFQRLESASEIITELGGRSTAAQKSVEDVISERIDDSLTKSVSYSADDSGTEVYDDYSETFVSESESTDNRRSRKSDYTQRNSGNKSSGKGKGRERRVVVEEKSVDITAADDRGFTHHYNTTQTGIHVSPAYGLQYVDPTPVSSHVIDADALEALTAYSPNILALQDMMRSQLQLVKNFMEIQGRIYKSCLDGLSEDFQYTTLEDTKEYISKHRKPRMTFDDALKLVDLEEKNIS